MTRPQDRNRLRRLHKVALRIKFGSIGSVTGLLVAVIVEVVLSLLRAGSFGIPSITSLLTPSLSFSLLGTVLSAFSPLTYIGYWKGTVLVGLWSGLLSSSLACALWKAARTHLELNREMRLFDRSALGKTLLVGILAGAVGNVLFIATSIWGATPVISIVRILLLSLIAGAIGWAVSLTVTLIPERMAAVVPASVCLATALSLQMITLLLPILFDRLVLATVIGFTVGYLIAFRVRLYEGPFGGRGVWTRQNIVRPMTTRRNWSGRAGVIMFKKKR